MEMLNRPAHVVSFKCLDLTRTPPRGGLRGMITCEKSLGTFTHFWGGKTVPCGDSLCDACEGKAAKRWHSYFSLWTPAPSKHLLVEIPLAAAEELWAWEDRHASLRDTHVTLARRADRDNGRVTITFSLAHAGQLALPSPPDIEQQLRVIWGLELREHVSPTTAADTAALARATRDVRINNANP